MNVGREQKCMEKNPDTCQRTEKHVKRSRYMSDVKEPR
jgi:hypothetical protein